MATRTLKARVELDGEKQYKQALSELNQGNKVLASEMKKLQAEYKGNSESTEFLTKKGELLERQLLQQKDKVEKLREALQRSAEQYGESSKQTQDWQIKLNNAEAAQYDLEHAIEENNKALQGENKEMVSLGDVADQLANKLGVKLPEGAKKALDGMKGMSSGSVAALGAIAAAVTVAIKAVKELYDTTVDVAADIDEVITQSMIHGLSTATVQEFQYMENLIDVSSGTLMSSLSKLTKSMASARNESSDTAKAFAELGVSIYDSQGNLRDAEDVWYEAIDALGGIENETERNILATQLFGKSAEELNPIIAAGTDTIRELAAEAHDMGFVLGEEDVAALGALDDAVQRNELMWESLKKQLAAQFAPAAKEALEAFTKLTKEAGEALVNSRLIENLGSIITAISGVINFGTQLANAMPGWMNPLKQVSNAFKGLAVVIATVVDAMKVLIGLTPAFWGSGMLREGLGLGASSGNYSNLQQVLGYDRSNVSGWVQASDGTWVANGWNATGNDNWRGGLTWVGEAGPELVSLPRGSQIMSAQESAGAVGGQYITINVQGIEQLDEVVRWYDSRRVRERMR